MVRECRPLLRAQSDAPVVGLGLRDRIATKLVEMSAERVAPVADGMWDDLAESTAIPSAGHFEWERGPPNMMMKAMIPKAAANIACSKRAGFFVRRMMIIHMNAIS
jgi:hypothetical protein